jgi:hypothetical protein
VESASCLRLLHAISCSCCSWHTTRTRPGQHLIPLLPSLPLLLLLLLLVFHWQLAALFQLELKGHVHVYRCCTFNI